MQALPVELMVTADIPLLALSTERFWVWTEKLDLVPHSSSPRWQSIGFRLQPNKRGWDLENSVAVLAEVILRQWSQSKQAQTAQQEGIITTCPREKVSLCIILTELGLNWAAFCIRTSMCLCPFLDLTPFIGQLRFWACRHPFPLCFGEWIYTLPLSWPSFYKGKEILSWFKGGVICGQLCVDKGSSYGCSKLCIVANNHGYFVWFGVLENQTDCHYSWGSSQRMCSGSSYGRGERSPSQEQKSLSTSPPPDLQTDCKGVLLLHSLLFSGYRDPDFCQMAIFSSAYSFEKPRTTSEFVIFVI